MIQYLKKKSWNQSLVTRIWEGWCLSLSITSSQILLIPFCFQTSPILPGHKNFVHSILKIDFLIISNNISFVFCFQLIL